MVQEASLDTLALAGAMAAALFAALTYMLGRQSHRTSALIWWAAAFAIESLRLALIFLVDSPHGGRAEIVGAGGHAFVAVSILIGVQAWFDRPRHRQGHWALAGLTTAIMLAGLLDPRATGAAASLLYALAVSPLAIAVWLFCQNQRSGIRPSDLFAAVALTLFIVHLAFRALSSLGVGAVTHGVGEWDALAHVGLSFLTLTCLVIAAQHRAFLAGRKGQERLAVSEQRFRDVAEVAGDWVWETGPDLRYTYFSDRVQESVGVDPKHLLGRTRRDLMGEDPQQPHLCAHLKDLDARRSFRNFEYSFDPGVGGKRYLRVSGKPIYDARGQFLGYRGTGTDVTEEVVAKRTAELLDRRLKDAFEGMPYGVALFDADDRLVLHNSKLATIYPSVESLMVPGRRFEDILRAAAARELFPAAGDDLALYIEERLEQHRTATAMPFQQLLSDGRWVQITESRTGDRGTVTAWSDITWLKRREAALALLLQSDPEDDSFFDVAAEALSTGLDCRWTGIGRLCGERFEVLATQGSGWPDDVLNLDLKGSPGGKVIESRGYLTIPDQASELFPEDTMLAELGVVSYQGHAFLDAEGDVLGHVFAMNDRPETANSHNRELVSLVARWVGAEFERRCAKQDLSESEARFRDYAETSADWFWETDMEQRFTSCIHSVAASAGSNIMVGKTRDEVQELIHAEPNLAPIVAGHMAKGEEFRGLEFRCNDPKLGTRWVRVSGRPMHALDGELVGYRGTGRDVTDQVAARNEREEAAKLLEALFENMAQGVSVTDADLNVVAFNHRFLDLLRFPKDRFEIGDPFEKFIRYNAERGEYGPGDPDQQVRERIELAKQCKPHYLERTRPDGVVLEIRGNPLPGGGFVTTYTDVTERKQAETALRQNTAFVELSKTTAAAANEASSVEEALETCVAEVCRHFGWPAGHAYVPVPDGSGELSPSMIWHLADSQKFFALRQITMRSRFAPGEGLPGRVLATRRPVWISDIHKDTNFPRAQAGEDIGVAAAIGFPVLIGTEVAAVLEFFAEEAIEPDESALEAMTHIGKQIGRVIERARAERQLLSAKDAAERADRTKGEFLATMSHELRTPLNAIIGFSEIMGQELYGPLGHGTYKEYADDIQTSATHLLNIINDILDISKAEAGMIALAEESVDLVEAIETSLRLFKPRALEKGIDFELDLPQAATRVRGDRQRLNQVLLNLLSNAVKFTNQGSITVRLRCNPEDGVLLQIVDTGFGISEADLERIMEPFTQADSTLSRTHEGTGLGLPLSRVFVEAHDGKLTIESVFGEGSTATLRLPASRLLGAADAA